MPVIMPIIKTTGGSEPHKTAAINYANFDNGTFKETLDDGTELTYTVEFADGKPSKVIAPDGTETTIAWDNASPDGMMIDGFEPYANGYRANLSTEQATEIIDTIKAMSGATKNTSLPIIVVFDGIRCETTVEYYDETAMDGEGVLINDSRFTIAAWRYMGSYIFTPAEGTSHTFSFELVEEG